MSPLDNLAIMSTHTETAVSVLYLHIYILLLVVHTNQKSSGVKIIRQQRGLGLLKPQQIYTEAKKIKSVACASYITMEASKADTAFAYIDSELRSILWQQRLRHNLR